MDNFKIETNWHTNQIVSTRFNNRYNLIVLNCFHKIYIRRSSNKMGILRSRNDLTEIQIAKA